MKYLDPFSIKCSLAGQTNFLPPPCKSIVWSSVYPVLVHGTYKYFYVTHMQFECSFMVSQTKYTSLTRLAPILSEAWNSLVSDKQPELLGQLRSLLARCWKRNVRLFKKEEFSAHLHQANDQTYFPTGAAKS